MCSSRNWNRAMANCAEYFKACVRKSHIKKKLNQTGPRIRSGDLVLVGTGDQTDPGLAVPVTHLDAEMTPSRSRKRRRIALACSLPPTAVRFNSPSCLGEKIEGTSRTGILNSLPDDIQPYIYTNHQNLRLQQVVFTTTETTTTN